MNNIAKDSDSTIYNVNDETEEKSLFPLSTICFYFCVI